MIIKNVNPVEPSSGSNGKLLLFFAGWGMDENPFKGYLPSGYDFAIAYDYRSFAFDETFLKPCSEIKIVAWSMGVWAASQLLQDKNYPITEAIAVNGTPFPVDDRKGIPHEIFAKTLGGMDENMLGKFRRRMCGSSDVLKRFLEKAPERSLENLREELGSIGKNASGSPPSSFKWDKVYIGSRDKIFPAANQMRAWEGTDYAVTDWEHYPDEEFWKELFKGKERQL